jgi:surface polysaccharide O-acyltransferase-like enzyme
MLHYLKKGGALDTGYGSEINTISWVLEAFCIVAVNCYMFITGYFLIKSKFSIIKILKLWGQVLFYSITIYLIFLFTNIIDFNIKDMIVSFMPIITKEYWFVTVYILLYLLSPYLNILIYNLSKKQFKTLIGIMLFVFCICTTFLPSSFTLDTTRGYGIIWFVCLYFIGAYIRLHFDGKSKINILNFLLYFIITILVIVSRFIITDICNIFNVNTAYNLKFYEYNSITILLSSIFLFLFFKNLNINSNIIKTTVLKIAPLTLGVYLIHEQSNMRIILYKNILNTSNYLDNNFFVIISITSSILIFIICIFVEFLRNNLVIYLSKTKLYLKLECFTVLKYKNIIAKSTTINQSKGK